MGKGRNDVCETSFPSRCGKISAPIGERTVVESSISVHVYIQRLHQDLSQDVLPYSISSSNSQYFVTMASASDDIKVQRLQRSAVVRQQVDKAVSKMRSDYSLTLEDLQQLAESVRAYPVDDLATYIAKGGDVPSDLTCTIKKGDFDVNGSGTYWVHTSYDRGGRQSYETVDKRIYLPKHRSFVDTWSDARLSSQVRRSLAGPYAERVLENLTLAMANGHVYQHGADY
jgi:hypothetical protein